MDRAVERRPGVTGRLEGSELLLTDTTTGEVHAVDGAAALVWRSLGDDAPAGLLADLDGTAVAAAVTRLAVLGVVTVRPGLSRRALFRGLGAAFGRPS